MRVYLFEETGFNQVVKMNNIYTKINNMQRHSNSYKRTVKRMTAFLLVIIVVLCAAGCKSTKSGGTVIPGSAVTPARKQGNISDITGNNKDRTLVGLLVAVDTSLKNMHFVDVESGTE